jgi:DNA-binding GntR family transcriptional regulator
MDHKFGGLERTTTPEGVYRVLRAAILDGTVPPGGQLRERDIATDLGVSRSPLREALTRLEEEGLIVKIPFRGAFVVEVSAREVAEIASIRLLVEPYAGELALETLRGPERPRLNQAVEELRQATDKNDIPASIDAHLQFHRLFYDFSGHGVLRGLWNGWETKLRLYLAVDHRSYSDVHDIAREHEGLVARVLEGDVDGFRREVAAHFPSALGIQDGRGSAGPGAHDHATNRQDG